MRLLDQRQKSLIGHDFATVNNYHHTLTIKRVAVQLCIYLFVHLSIPLFVHLSIHVFEHISNIYTCIFALMKTCIWVLINTYICAVINTCISHCCENWHFEATASSRLRGGPAILTLSRVSNCSRKKFFQEEFFFKSQGKYTQSKYHIDNLFF